MTQVCSVRRGVSSIKINTLWEELKDGLTVQVKENY